MLVTRQEQFTAWIYQGAHMGERAATVGVGLMDGYIYFRPSNDSIGSDERILRDKYYVELSDETEYPLGEGESAHKITIKDLGYLNGEARVQVIGKPEVGVGVSRILRRVTIEYDDGKVPVLDTDQLNGILAELNDNLEQSMVGTAEAVKEELRQEVANSVIDTKSYCDTKITEASEALSTSIESVRGEMRSSVTNLDTKVDATTARLDSKIDTSVTGMDTKVSSLRTELDSRIVLVENSVTSMDSEIESMRTDLTGAIEERVRLARWSFGQYSISNTAFNNILFSAPATMSGDTVFTYNADNKSLVLNTPPTSVDRMLRLSVITTLEVPNNWAGHLVMHVRNIAGGTQTQTIVFLNRDHGLPQHVQNVFFETELCIPGNFENHPLYGAGFRIEFIHSKSGNVVLKSGSINMTLLTS